MSTPLSHVVIRFAGDSGDGMQLTGSQFTRTSALAGNDLATLPDFPAEIRAPAGTREGVSGFQLQFASDIVHTPGDETDVLVAMNAAALITNLSRLKERGILVVNTDKFRDSDLAKARLETNPLEDGTLEGFRVIDAPISTLTKEAVKPFGLNVKQSDRCKNFFALGMMYWLYGRDMVPTQAWISSKFKAPYDEANLAALQAGFDYANTIELFSDPYEVAEAPLSPGKYRNITGNAALALGFAAAATRSDRLVFYGSYPITPASDILHALAPFKGYGVVTFQAEDEIAAVAATIGASYGGHLGVTGTSGPGVALKGEAIGLAVMAELPLVVVNVQRGGPSTGLPTKTEQSDLLQAMYGRNGEAPMVVLAARSPSDCFDTAVEACRIALELRTPVMLMSDGYIANGAEPWPIPDLSKLPDLRPHFETEPEGFRPYDRDPETLARKWAIPGTPGLEHRIGGLEKEDGTGNVSYDPPNHQYMCELRAAKVRKLAERLPPCEVYGDEDGILVMGWGSTWGAIRTAVEELRSEGMKLGHLHLRYINPFPKDIEEVMARYHHILVPELNLGQLTKLLRSEFLVDARPVNKIQGQPFTKREVVQAIRQYLADIDGGEA